MTFLKCTGLSVTANDGEAQEDRRLGSATASNKQTDVNRQHPQHIGHVIADLVDIAAYMRIARDSWDDAEDDDTAFLTNADIDELVARLHQDIAGLRAVLDPARHTSVIRREELAP